MRLLPILALVCACDDTQFHEGAPEPVGEGWCAVQSIIRSECLTCHSAELVFGDLDLETDPHGALVEAPSIGFPGEILVVPGDPDASLMILKLLNTQGDNGGEMPPSNVLPTEVTDPVVQWALDGADDVCGGGGTTGPVARQHTPLWAAPDQHGLAVEQQTYDDCRTCHGGTLQGGIGPSCDTCHDGGSDAWRTDCVFCHGGEQTDGGAPPADVDREAIVGFPGHTAHVTETIHAAWDCTECHAKPVDVLTPGHFFDDDTPAVAELDFSLGLASGGSYAGGTCDTYCHGNGRTLGAASTADPARTCDDCHSTTATFSQLSGEHDEHLDDEDITCTLCHGTVVDEALAIVAPERHVQGTPDVALPYLMSRSGDTCTGSCHGEQHDSEEWF